MNRCPDCNKRLRKNAEFCPRCGWKKRRFGLGIFRSLIPKKRTPTGVCPDCGTLFYQDDKQCCSCGWSYRKKRKFPWLLFIINPGLGLLYWLFPNLLSFIGYILLTFFIIWMIAAILGIFI